VQVIVWVAGLERELQTELSGIRNTYRGARPERSEQTPDHPKLFRP